MFGLVFVFVLLSLVEVMNPTNDGDVLAMSMDEVVLFCFMQCP
jgi:hypothetical protein